jgi:uracil-DNA glycosylase
LTVPVLFFWGALSDERTGLSFVSAAGPRQRNLSLVLVPWDSRSYFTVSDLRLPFPSPPTTRRFTVEVFEPASTRVKVKVKVTLRLTVGQSVSLGVEPHLGLMTRYLLLFDGYGLVFVGRPPDERTGLSFVSAAGPRQRSLSQVRVPFISRPYFTVSVLRLPF